MPLRALLPTSVCLLALAATVPLRAGQLTIYRCTDAGGKLNLSLRDAAAHSQGAGQDSGLLLVSQFTLYADTRRGRRPSFTDAAPPDVARALYNNLVADLRAACEREGLRFGTGRFGADMRLTFTNWGPVTILLDSQDFESAG